MLIVAQTIELGTSDVIIPVHYQAYVIAEVGAIQDYMDPLFLGYCKDRRSSQVVFKNALDLALTVPTY